MPDSEACNGLCDLKTQSNDMNVTTASDNTQSVIEKFGARYRANEDNLRAFLSHVHNLIEDLSRDQVQGSVTSRLKSWHSLHTKLQKRVIGNEENSPKAYNTVADIEKDEELDIFAARIRVFFPKQMPKAKQIVQKNFKLERKRPFSAKWKYIDGLSNLKEEHGSYEAAHYWVKLNEYAINKLPLNSRKFKNRIIEIQVRSSMFMDAWAEAREDIVYKAFGGMPSDAERVLLDCMKGIVKPVESLLNHLLDVHEDRIRSDTTMLDAKDLLEKEIIRAIPKLAGEKIENVPALYGLFKALSINTTSRLKDVIRSNSNFSNDFNDFLKSRKTSKQQTWIFILKQIFLTLSALEIEQLLQAVSIHGKVHQLFCRSISWLENNLSETGNAQDNALEPEEKQRCTLIWILHEYIAAKWPTSELTIVATVQWFLLKIKQSPVPRIDTSIYVAMAETVSDIQYEIPMTPTLQRLRSLCNRDILFDYSGNRFAQQIFRWHQHDSFYTESGVADHIMSNDLRRLSARLLRINLSQLNGALLLRAVAHKDKRENLRLVKGLLSVFSSSDMSFVNDSEQSALHIASIFAPTSRTLELLLDEKSICDLVNARDFYGATALLCASLLRHKGKAWLLLHVPGVDVNLAGRGGPEVAAVADFPEEIEERLPLTTDPMREYCTRASELTPAEWHRQGGRIGKMRTLVAHSSFDPRRNFSKAIWEELVEHGNCVDRGRHLELDGWEL